MRTAVILVSALLWMCIHCTAVGAEPAVTSVDTSALSALQFPSTGDSSEQKYLGISSGDSVSLGQIRAERLIIVVFNSYCSICQLDAPVLNVLYGAVQDDPRLKGRTKIVGIAAGNTRLEVEDFRSTHEVPFPLFPDPNFSMDRAIPSNLRVPIVIIAKNTPEQSLEILKIHQGKLKDVDGFLDMASEGTARTDAPSDARAKNLALNN